MNNNQVALVSDEGTVLYNGGLNVNELLNVDNNYLKTFAPGFNMSEEDMYNALQNPQKPVSDCIGDEFYLCGVVAHVVEVIKQDTGELIPCPRMILIGSKGESYVSVSKTLYSSLKNLFAMYRQPSEWPEGGIPIKLKQFNKGEKRYFSIELLKKK